MSPKIYALFGNVSSGKSTLAKSLSEHFGGIPHLSSDGIREELTGDVGGHSGNVFETLDNRLGNHLKKGTSVVIDSTGMSPKYHAIIKKYQSQYPMQIIQLHCDPEVWKQREKLRNDRWTLDENGQKKPFEMPERAYKDSSNVKITPHLFLDTSHMKPQEVFDKALQHLGEKSKNEGSSL